MLGETILRRMERVHTKPTAGAREAVAERYAVAER